MFSINSLRLRLILSFSLIALMNIFIISYIIYDEAHTTLIEQAQKHMVSVRSLLHQKLLTIEENGANNWDEILAQREGLGETGEIYLVGADYKIKSASRFIENAVGTLIRNTSVDKGLSGISGVGIVQDYRKVDVVSAYAPIKLSNRNLVLIAEVDLKEVISPLNEVIYKVLQVTFGIILFNGFLIYLTTKIVVHKFLSLNRKVDEVALQVLKAQEDERQKLAYNLHDSAGQYLTVLKWKLSSLEKEDAKFQELNKLCDTIISEIRSISQDLMPATIKDFGCFEAIKVYLTKQKSLLGIQIECSIDPSLDPSDFSDAFSVNFYRIVQELVQNTIKHAQASNISVRISSDEKGLVLEYADDGVGNKNTIRPRSVNYRVNLFHGKYLESHPDQGMKVTIIFNTEKFNHEKYQTFYS